MVKDEEFRAEGVRRVEREELFSGSDILSLHCPLTPETRGIVNARTLAQMKPHALLVNTSRGGLVETGALVEALRSGTIAGAGLDVFDPEPLPADHPLRLVESALLTSHTAAKGCPGGAFPAEGLRERLVEDDAFAYPVALIKHRFISRTVSPWPETTPSRRSGGR
jgi:hypothetical protein